MSLVHYLFSKNRTGAESDDEPRRNLLKAKVVPLPTAPKITAKANHIPELVIPGFSSRCRNQGFSERTKFRCTTCKIFL
ncbi:hypothetical protein HPB48_011189 [Haemaphysalis longicornis]|uniref:Uncharacterized protein n=1 Tax=Haemaphysalis longicornis TaxID=44386 RepID=A0A9J6GXU5_HAELO|nr:hypothetical protein HPB48_011189 [Haemaphysalis longicornis]